MNLVMRGVTGTASLHHRRTADDARSAGRSMTSTPPGTARVREESSPHARHGAHVGFIGLGDQGLPMAVAIAQAGFPLHVWARRPTSLEGLGTTPATVHATLPELAAACDIVAFCVSTDEDVLELLSDGVLAGLPPGAVVVNHGTGTPRGAERIAELCSRAGVPALDAPVSGGRPAAETRALTVLVGGPAEALERCVPVFEAFAEQVVPMGPVGAGQAAKLFNNVLLSLNQAAIADIVQLAIASGIDPDRLVAALRLGSARSRALTLLGEMVTAATVAHLSAVEDLDVDLFATAMAEAAVHADPVVARAHAGARGLPALVDRLPITAGRTRSQS
jgi:3-hydroxyisobutyrate dehydrogenase-like beta-hydroxyacid dehydrogenase